MAEFNLKIAGHVGRVHSLFDSTKDYCRNYLTEEEAEFEVIVTPEDLSFEQAELLAEAKAEGMKPRKFTDPFLDRAAIQRKFADYLFEITDRLLLLRQIIILILLSVQHTRLI